MGEDRMIEPENLLKHLILKANEQKWYQLIAKWKRYVDSESRTYTYGQKSLLAHSVATAWTSYRIASIVNLNEEDRLLALASGFLHDIGKAREDFQSAAESGSKKPEDYHHHTPDLVRHGIHLFFEGKDSELPNGFENRVYELIMALEVPESIGQLSELMRVSVDRKLVAIVEFADELESIKTLDGFKSKRWGSKFENNLKILGLEVTYHELSVIRGAITQLLHDAFHKAFVKKGFHHIMYFPTGTVYIYFANGQYSLPALDEVKEALKESINEMVKAFGRSLGPKAFGSLNTAHFKAPEFLYTSKEAVISFWDHIFETQIPKDFKKIDLDEKTKTEIKNLPNFSHLSDDEQRVFGLQLERITRTCILMADIIKHAIEGERDEGKVRDFVKKAFLKRFSIKDIKFLDEVLDEMKVMALQKPEVERVSFAINLIKLCALENDLKKAWKELKEFFIELTDGLRPMAKKAYNIDKLVDENISSILEEVVYPPLGGPLNKIVEQTAKAYLQGKKKGTPLCAFCGREATEPAIFKRFGSGSESFNNFLSGGTVIGGKNKVQVCGVCSLESKLKLLVLENPSQMLVLAPQLKLDGYTARLWRNTCQQLVNWWGYAKGRGLQGNYLEWAKTIFSGDDIQALPEESKIVELLTIDERTKLKKVITRMLEDKENGPIYERVLSKAGYAKKDIDVLVNDFLDGSLESKLKSISGGETLIENIYSEAEIIETSMSLFISPNFMMILLKNEIRDYEESDSSAKLRQIFIGTVLGKVFQSCVNIVDDPNALITFTRPPEGYLQIPRSAIISNILSRYNVDPEKTGWLAVQRVDTVLRKFSAMILTEDMLRSHKADYGQNTLLKVSETIPGEILNRLYQSKKKVRREDFLKLIEYLNVMEN